METLPGVGQCGRRGDLSVGETTVQCETGRSLDKLGTGKNARVDVDVANVLTWVFMESIWPYMLFSS